MSHHTMRSRLLFLGATLLPVLAAGCRTEEKTVAVPAGTSVVVALETPLSTETASEGQAFTAVTTEPIMVDGKTVAISGTAVRGYVTDIAEPGQIKGSAQMTLNFEELVTVEGEAYPFVAEPITLTAKSDTQSDVERVAGTTAAGAIIGGIAEGGKGAIIGGLIGAGAGGAWAVVTKGDQIVLGEGQQFRIEIAEPAELPVLAAL